MAKSSNRLLAEHPDLPARLREAMFKSSSGELAWPLDEAGEAVTWIASRGLSTLGGEAWHLDEVGQITAVIPVTGSAIPAVRGWSVKDRQQDEHWQAFVVRCRDEGLIALAREAATIREEVPPTLHRGLRYNLTVVSEQEYLEL